MPKLSPAKIDFLILVILALIAGFFRFFLIHKIPCGLFPDQATYGLDALRFSHGFFSPVFGGKEGLFIYLLSLSHLLFGTGIWQIFVVSAAIGTATVLITYLATRQFFGHKIAFLTGFFLAVSSWHIALSRNGFRANLIPLFISLFAYFLAKSLHATTTRQRQAYYPLTAATFALGFYTYHAYLIFAFSIFLLALFFLFKNYQKIPAFIQVNKRALVRATFIFTVIIFPIALFVLLFPEKYFARSGQISIFTLSSSFSELAITFSQNLWLTVSGIFTTGDFNWRHNTPGHPLLHPLLSPFFFITFFYALFKKRHLLIFFFLFLMMLLPALLTQEGSSPHGLRLIGIIPVIFLLPALSISYLLGFKSKLPKFFGLSLISLLLIFTTTSGYQNYFQQAPTSAHFYQDFRCDLTTAAGHIQAHQSNIQVISDRFSFETVRYLLDSAPIDHHLPQEFLHSFPNHTFRPSEEIILLSSFGNFDANVLALLSANFQPQIIKNPFGGIDFYLFTSLTSAPLPRTDFP